MKREAAISLSVVVVCLTLLYPQFAQARNAAGLPPATNTANPAGQRQALLMVPAEASLIKGLNAKKIKSGYMFQARLGETVHLKNGPELPRGTLLLGTVGTDRMEKTGISRMALRFTQAKLKNGKLVPIKATIVAITSPDDDSYEDPATEGLTQLWNSKILQIDQLNAISGVDLHSKIASKDSGVLVSNKKDDVKLSAGSQITLAIAASTDSQQSRTNGGI